MGRWLDRLFIRSKAKRRSREMNRESARRDSEAQTEHRERQQHYRQVTQSDERGRDTRPEDRTETPPEP